jgi:hypothetical protein
LHDSDVLLRQAQVNQARLARSVRARPLLKTAVPCFDVDNREATEGAAICAPPSLH